MEYLRLICNVGGHRLEAEGRVDQHVIDPLRAEGRAVEILRGPQCSILRGDSGPFHAQGAQSAKTRRDRA